MLFTHSAYILTIRPPSIDELERQLKKNFDIDGRTEAESEANWAMGNGALMVRMDGVETGRILIDVLDQKWPDDMGSELGKGSLFQAWSSGVFGPLVYPGAMTRAARQAWVWKQASGAARAHIGFVRLRAMHVAPEGDQTPEAPNPRDELVAITAVARRLLMVNGSLCYFNPSAEALRPPPQVFGAMDQHKSEGLLPIDLWTNVRVVGLEGEGEWTMMDTVGMSQLGLPDLEACFPRTRFEMEVVDVFLRSITDYLAESGDVIEEGHTIDGPGEVDWTVSRLDQGMAAPPRPVIRLVPSDAGDPPAALVAGFDGEGVEEPGAPGADPSPADNGSEGLEAGEPRGDGE